MKTLKVIFSRFLIVSWVITIAIGLFNIDEIEWFAIFCFFLIAIQFIFFGTLHPLKLLEYGKNND